MIDFFIKKVMSIQNKKKRKIEKTGKRRTHRTTAHAQTKFGDENLRRMKYQSSSLIFRAMKQVKEIENFAYLDFIK